jgi:hypothetical protein
MNWNEAFRRTVHIMAEHGQITLSGDLADENTMIEFNPKGTTSRSSK